MLHSLLHLPRIFTIFFFFLPLFCCCSAEDDHLSSQENTFPALFAFGDSIFDTGNNNFLDTLVKSNFPPYGRDFVGGKPTGRFSNGKVALDFLVELLGIKELLPPFLDPTVQVDDLATGTSFASGGSGFDPLTPKSLSVISMHGQLELFKQYKTKLETALGSERTSAIVSDGLYVVTAGSDDIGNTYYHTNLRRKTYTISNYTDFLTTSASSFFEGLYHLGARHINFFGITPLGCLPISRTVGGGLERQCVTEYNDAAQQFNANIAQLFQHLHRVLPLAQFNYVDSYTIVLDMIQNPGHYGFDVWDRGCCGSGFLETIIFCNRWSPFTCSNASTFLFWDSYHPTQKGYRILTQHLIGQLR